MLKGRVTWAAGLFAFSSIVYLAPKLFNNQHGDPAFGGDFRMVWLAGKIWAAGQDPYGPLFETAYLDAFGPSNNMYWVYPPFWWPVALPFGFLPFPTANVLWNLFNFLFILTAAHLIARAIADATKQSYLTIVMTGVGFACFMQATALSIYIGQTSVLILFGFAAWIYGIIHHRPTMMILGMVFLALKPQIGAVAFIAVTALPRWRWTVLAAGLACLLAAIPSLATGGCAEIAHEYLGNLIRYPRESGPANAPPNLIGLIQLIDYVHTVPVNALLNLMLSLAAMASGWLIFSLMGDRKQLG
jgi:hypothetical protein